MRAIDRLKSEAVRYVRDPTNTYVFRIRRPPPAVLARHGAALGLLQAEAVFAILEAKLDKEPTEKSDIAVDIEAQLAAMSPEDRAAALEKRARYELRNQLLEGREQIQATERLVRDHPEKLVAAEEAHRAIVCAAVTGLLAVSEHDIPDDATLVGSPAEAMLLQKRRTLAWEAECEQVGHQVEKYPPVTAVDAACSPLQLVLTEAEVAGDPDRAVVDILGPKVIEYLSERIQELAGAVPADVQARFPGGRRARRAARRDGEAVRAEAV